MLGFVKRFLCSCVLLTLPEASLYILFFGVFAFLVYFLLFVLCCQFQCTWLPGKIRLRNDLLSVEWDVKLDSLYSLCINSIISTCASLHYVQDVNVCIVLPFSFKTQNFPQNCCYFNHVHFSVRLLFHVHLSAYKSRLIASLLYTYRIGFSTDVFCLCQ